MVLNLDTCSLETLYKMHTELEQELEKHRALEPSSNSSHARDYEMWVAIYYGYIESIRRVKDAILAKEIIEVGSVQRMRCKMKFITDYREFDGDQEKSLLDHISADAFEGKAKVLSYLKSGIDDGVRCAGVYDYVKDEPQFDTVYLFTDGEYYWDSEEIYHFEKYNVALNNDFIQKILNIS